MSVQCTPDMAGQSLSSESLSNSWTPGGNGRGAVKSLLRHAAAMMASQLHSAPIALQSYNSC